jgi:hypothetical protein
MVLIIEHLKRLQNGNFSRKNDYNIHINLGHWYHYQT